MVPISVTADAGLHIIRRIAMGELKISGIQVRDTEGKIRYILRGFEDLKLGDLGDLPPLEALKTVMNVTQMLQTITIAQNAAIAQSLRRIEARLETMEKRLEGIESRLKRLASKQNLILEALRSGPLSRLKAARAAAFVALQHEDRAALIISGQNAQQAFHDLLAQAQHLVRVEEDGLPVALQVPIELADLAQSAVEAAAVASAIWVALDNIAEPSRIMRQAANAFEAMRHKLAAIISDPEFMLRRIKVDDWQDAKLLEAAARLREVMLWSRAREVLIEQKVILSDPSRVELERSIPAQGISFLPVVVPQVDPIQ